PPNPTPSPPLSPYTTLFRSLVEITKRRSLLRRSADDTDPTERVLVANVDVLGIVTATVDPEPSYGLIDRALVAAFDADIDPLLIDRKSTRLNSSHVSISYAV